MGRQPRTPGPGKKAQPPEPPPPSAGVPGFLRQHKDTILRSWESRATAEAHEVGLTGLALRDDIPVLLDELATWLASDAAPETSLLAAGALAHVMQRLDAGLALGQVLREYRRLRETIIEEVLGAEAAEQERASASGQAQRIVRVEELARLNSGLDVVLSHSIEQFVEERDRRAAVERASAAQDLTESEARYRSLFESIDEGFCIIEVLFDDAGKGVDHRFVEMNPAFERHTGLVNANGKTARELVPNLETKWPERYGRIAMTGKPERFEMESAAMGRWFDVYAFATGSPHERRVGLIFSDITPRKRADEERRISEARYRALFEDMNEGFVLGDMIWDQQGSPVDWRYVEVNEAWARQTGVPVAETVGRTAREVNPGIESGWIETYGKVVRTGQPARYESYSSGFRKWFEIFAFKHSENRFGLLFHDITGRKQAEQALRESEARLRALWESGMLGVLMFDLAEGSITDANYKFLEMVGYSRDDLAAGRVSWARMTPAEYRALDEQAVEELHATGVDTPYEKEFIRKDGSRLPIFIGAATYDQERNRGVSFVLDMTPAKELDRQRQLSEQRLRTALLDAEQRAAEIDAILQAMPHAVFFGTTEGITRCNAEALSILGASSLQDLQHRIEQLGRNFRIRHDREPDGRAVEPENLPFNRALAGEVAALDTWATKADTGESALIRGYAAPVLLAGRTIGAVAVNIDITDQFEMREELVGAKERLEEADRRKNHFLAVLSHELRNPLTPIKNSLYILDRAVPGGDQARRAKDVIERQIDQLSHLVDDLLDVTRITRGKIQLQRRRLELNELVRRTMDDHRAVFENAGVRLELEAASQQVFVDGDWSRVAQVVSNLLQNSAKFTPRGGRVAVTVAREPETRQAIIRVADNGAGMPRELLDRLFQPFIQADETLDRSRGGLGLGLALVKGIVELHGGSIQATSQGPNLGSEFVVRLPLDLSAPAMVEQRQVRAEGAHHRVLIIEDNVDAAESLKEVLELCGHEVMVTHDGPEGLARAREVRPDVVLCDIGLPGMDGYEVARALRRDDGLRDVRLVALSGYALPDDLQRAAEAGFETHIAKPPSLSRIEAALGNGAPPR